LSGFDLVTDVFHDTVWVTGATTHAARISTRRVSVTDAAPLGSGVSIDVAPDGTVWVAERDIQGGVNAVRHIDVDGATLQTITPPGGGSPFGVRVDPLTSDVWFTATNGVYRATPGGDPVTVTTQSGFGIAAAYGGGGMFVDDRLAGTISLYDSSGALVASSEPFLPARTLSLHAIPTPVQTR
jgi:DNA-binding beta-propeller fold protein YncE